jgi:bacterial/archaeal transporter family-2 protein
MIAFHIVAALVAGALITVQTGSNARLKDALGNALPAVVVSSLIGIVALVAVIAVTRTPPPAAERFLAAPWTAWLGGFLGAIYAVTVVVVARELGASTLTALVITGQLICSVALDHFGLLGFEVRAAGIGRLVGCLLLLAGTLLIWKL